MRTIPAFSLAGSMGAENLIRIQSEAVEFVSGR